MLSMTPFQNQAAAAKPQTVAAGVSRAKDLIEPPKSASKP